MPTGEIGPPSTEGVVSHRGGHEETVPVVITAVAPGPPQLPGWLKEVVVLIGGVVTLSSQIWVKTVQHEDPSAFLIIAGLALLGVTLPGFVWADRHKT